MTIESDIDCGSYCGEFDSSCTGTSLYTFHHHLGHWRLALIAALWPSLAEDIDHAARSDLDLRAFDSDIHCI